MLPKFIVAGFCCAMSLSAVAAPDPATQLKTGQVWDDFCEQLKVTGSEILKVDAVQSELERAEGYRYLTEQLRRSIDQVLMARDKAQPLLILTNSKWYKWAADAADQKNMAAMLDSEGTYKLYGTLGTARLTAIQLAATMPEYRAFGSLSNEQLGTPGEAFQVLLSREKPEGYSGPWIPMPPEANMVTVREYFYDWETERPGQMILERTDDAPAPTPLDVATMAAQLEQIAAVFAARVTMWLPYLRSVRENFVNALSPPRGSASQGLNDNLYARVWFNLQDNQALVITFEAPDALMWSFTLLNAWGQSLDYANHISSLNGAQAVASSDGKYRLVIAQTDPGVPNWLDTAGHESG
ncbi:MAG: hypothetical protein KDE45_12230, partial [Caldilineaceae bacterium]|nr:hypothetical protein [Caldilineaceae bacterium]